jgi:hypothetical protein
LFELGVEKYFVINKLETKVIIKVVVVVKNFEIPVNKNKERIKTKYTMVSTTNFNILYFVQSKIIK